MIFSLIFELGLVVGVSVVAHAVIAYVLAPRKAKQGILDALVSDTHFQSLLMQSLVRSANQPMKWTDDHGQEFVKSPIELLSSIISNKFQADFKSYIGGKQSAMMKDMESNAENAVSSMPDNPMLALAMSQIPKKYLPYVQLLANLLLNQQKP